MAWEQQLEFFGLPKGVCPEYEIVFELFEDDVARYEECREHVRRDAAARFEAEKQPDANSPWYIKSPRMPFGPNEGWPWPVDGKPFRYKMSEAREGSYDIDYTLTEKAIRAIETVEPGVHRYLPADIYRPDGSLEGRRWLFNCCSRLDTIALEHSPDLTQIGRGLWQMYHGHLFANPRIAVWESKVRGRSCWVEYKWSKRLMSDRLWEELQRSGVRGWDVDTSKHIVEI